MVRILTCMLILSVSLVSWASSPTNNLHAVHWAINDSPPFHLVNRPDGQTGLCDDLVEAFQQALPDVHHTLTVVPQARIAQMRQMQVPVCFPCMIKKPDSPTTLYTTATHVYPPHVLIANPAAADMILARYGEPVSLSAVLADAQLWFGQPAGRKYGELLQPTIANSLERYRQVIKVNTKEGAKGVLNMVALERLDYTLDYPFVGRYYEANSGNSFRYIPLQENPQQVIKGAIGCTRSDWGAQTIAILNQAVSKVQASPVFRQRLQYWLADDDPQYWQKFAAIEQPIGLPATESLFVD